MTDREKLIELLEEAIKESCLKIRCIDCNYYNAEPYPCRNELVADFLIANGVTVQQWIPATELPDVGVKVLTLDKWGHVRDRELYQFSDGLMLFRPDGMIPGKDITHWRPMLQGPNKEN